MLAFETSGQGSPAVFLHAFPLSSTMWKKEREYLSSKFKVITPDFPGFGKSSLNSGLTVADMADATAALLDSLKIQTPVFLAGLSMGGYAAFEFLRKYPNRVRAMGLFATRATPDTPEAREKRMQSIAAIEKFGIDPFARKIVKSQLGKTTQEKNLALVTEVLEMMKKTSPEAAIAALRALADRRDSSDLLKSISFPVLVVAGEEDEIAPAAVMKEMHAQIPGAEYHVLPGAAHLVNLEQPRLFRDILENFVKKL